MNRYINVMSRNNKNRMHDCIKMIKLKYYKIRWIKHADMKILLKLKII